MPAPPTLQQRCHINPQKIANHQNSDQTDAANPARGTGFGSATAILAAQLLVAERLADGTHRWKLEQGYEMGRPSDLWLEADVADAKLVAVRVAGQAVQISSGVLEI